MYSNKKLILAIAVIAILVGTTAYVAADSATGNVTVTPEIPIIKDISFPVSAIPGSLNRLTFTLQYQSRIAGGEELWMDFYSSGATPDFMYSGTPVSTSISLFNHYRAMWTNKLSDPWLISGNYGPAGVFQNPSTSPVPIIGDGSDIHFSLDVRFDELADATLIIIHFELSLQNPWTIKFHLKYNDANDGLVRTLDVFFEFDLAAFLGLNIEQSTFDFGDIEQGQGLIAISVPTQGFLDLSVQCSLAYMIQVSGTNPDDGSGNSFEVGNIYQNSVNDSSSAIPLTLIAADILNLGQHDLTPIGTWDYLILYLWIEIPIGTPLGTYTFSLTVTLVTA